MEEKSRTEYSARNTLVAVISRMAAILMGFATRVVFTHTLSESYVGVNGLFTDILNVLALSELGVGTAITYALYRPIAEGDIEKQKSLMRMYRAFYRIVAGFVLAAGLLVVPFMNVLIKNQPDVDHLIFIYLMYLANSVLSYLLIYKRTLVDAHQLIYIGTLYQTIFLIIQDVVQIVLLITTKNFLLFLCVYLICTLGTNLTISRKADKLYPYLRDKEVQPLDKAERKGIFKNIKAMLMHKIGTVVVNNTDNLLISSFVGIVSVGKYSNYYLVIGSIRQILDQVFQGITASVGNLGVTEDAVRVKKIFESSFFIGQWLYGFAAICLFELISPFVAISFGEQYLFDRTVVLVLCINFYITGMRKASLVFRDSLGLFWYDRYKSVAEAVINLVVSILLAVKFGVLGVFLGTFISSVTTSVWVEPYVLYKHHLKAPVWNYFASYVLYAGVLAAIWFATDWLCLRAQGGYFMLFVIRLGICLIVPNLLMLLFYCRKKEFRFVLDKGAALIKDRRGRGKGEEAKFAPEEEALFALLSGIFEEDCGECAKKTFARYPDVDWTEVLSAAKQHGVLALLYDSLKGAAEIPVAEQRWLEKTCREILMQNYHLLFLGHWLVELLEENGIGCLLLKGSTVSALYPVPELRKSGDIDLLLLHPEDGERCGRLLEENGFRKPDNQEAHHHISFFTNENIEIEVHVMLAEPFDNAKTNRFLDELHISCTEHMFRKEIMGFVFPVLDEGCQGFHLLLHMLQHFLRSGFGLKLLCDWVAFWRRDVGEKECEVFLGLVKKSGLHGFAKAVTAACVAYLGLKAENVSFLFEETLSQEKAVKLGGGIMREVMEAEEFGKSSNDRMVMMRGRGIWGFVREFHHQMHLNFPKGGKVFLLWPALWTATFVRFVNNNRKLRKISSKAILKKAKERSRLMSELKLFK